MSSGLAAPIESLKGLGPKRAAAWRLAGVRTVGELLRVPPRRHVRFDAATSIAALSDSTPATLSCIRVEIVRRKASGRRGIVATRLDVRDASGEVTAVLFGRRWLARSFARAERVHLRGERRVRAGSAEFLVRGWLHEEELAADASGTGPIFQPHYELPEGIAPRLHRRLVRSALDALRGPLSAETPNWSAPAVGHAASLHELLTGLHFPSDELAHANSRRAFALEASIAVQRRLRSMRRTRAARTGAPFEDARSELAKYLAALPFAPTGDQRRSLEEIAGDLESAQPMTRLLSGDVGSGKSAVAFFPLVVAARAGRQGALLAPTEILARQHVATLSTLLPALGLPPPRLIAAGAEASGRPKGRGSRERSSPIEDPIVVGTHRLLSAPVRFRDLAAVVVDEQHKFGVRQRSRLFDKGNRPDLLLVSATPIPRTLAHTLFGHLDLSLLVERPFDARCVKTELLLGGERRKLGARLRAELEAGGKAFVVCPAIGPDAKVVSAEQIAPWLQRELGPSLPVGLLHGRLESSEKQSRLEAFASGATRALVATVVVEVGIDVPDATVAVVLAAERFGLSQLHQIRGRVGRRGHPATCLLVSAEPSDEARARLESFAQLDDGFALAELDFKLRGPGELFGLRQHGLVPALYPEALLDPKLVVLAKELADSRNSAQDKPFRERSVATPGAFW